ncbi:hypothetical protein MNBD_ALPHA08-284 [hydrothermal vent metagenome]|uniref:Uncharacterized protein n=1 Tax=hydrothermal vent metagenome TaxID=652676 RepID=A0A3B0SLI5_9ZZZZ
MANRLAVAEQGLFAVGQNLFDRHVDAAMGNDEYWAGVFAYRPVYGLGCATEKLLIRLNTRRDGAAITVQPVLEPGIFSAALIGAKIAFFQTGEFNDRALQNFIDNISRLAGPLQGAGADGGNRLASKLAFCLMGLGDAGVIERNISIALQAPVKVPVSLAVADIVELLVGDHGGWVKGEWFAGQVIEFVCRAHYSWLS